MFACKSCLNFGGDLPLAAERVSHRDADFTRQVRPPNTQASYYESRAPAPQPNWAFNVDANMGHAFGIVMAHVGALRPTGSGAS